MQEESILRAISRPGCRQQEFRYINTLLLSICLSWSSLQEQTDLQASVHCVNLV